jgi:hypothetical protein
MEGSTKAFELGTSLVLQALALLENDLSAAGEARSVSPLVA